MNRLFSVAVAGTMLAACAAQPERETDTDIATTLSPGVIEIAKAEGGVVDTDKHDNVRCERVKIVGTHIHERVCYTVEEADELARRNMDEYYRRLGVGLCRDCGNN